MPATQFLTLGASLEATLLISVFSNSTWRYPPFTSSACSGASSPARSSRFSISGLLSRVMVSPPVRRPPRCSRRGRDLPRRPSAPPDLRPQGCRRAERSEGESMPPTWSAAWSAGQEARGQKNCLSEAAAETSPRGPEVAPPPRMKRSEGDDPHPAAALLLPELAAQAFEFRPQARILGLRCCSRCCFLFCPPRLLQGGEKPLAAFRVVEVQVLAVLHQFQPQLFAEEAVVHRLQRHVLAFYQPEALQARRQVIPRRVEEEVFRHLEHLLIEGALGVGIFLLRLLRGEFDHHVREPAPFFPRLVAVPLAHADAEDDVAVGGNGLPRVAFFPVEEVVAGDIDLRPVREAELERLNAVGGQVAVLVGFTHGLAVGSGIVDLARTGNGSAGQADSHALPPETGSDRPR